MLLTPPPPATIPDRGSASATSGARRAAVDVPAVGVGDDARMISTPAATPTTAATSTATTTTTRLLPRPRRRRYLDLFVARSVRWTDRGGIHGAGRGVRGVARRGINR